MLIARIEKSTRTLGAPADWDGYLNKCGALPIRDVKSEQGQWMVSAWEPTPQEIAALQAGATIKLFVYGTSHPVVALAVGELDESYFS